MKVKLATTGRVIELRRFGPWWKPWDRRGTLRIDHITGLHEVTPALARRLSDYDLHLMPKVRTNDSVLHTVLEAEQRRREGKTARQALAVSILSLLVAFAAVALKVS
ncbi:hypothetical protein SAQ01S_09000 [Sphingomonas aquatilis NBRC 16722]|uniref:Uncharacterized protein n=1 Tax=Sphingomonas aquatilis TaxID=93063 RepID=A0AAW3TNV5_9SPHN|nr:hypothetical protein [Sphingomonas aquatilis]MBB3874823.1 hypothetical protein [Sphingomonas aquatilis]GEM71134.1 hypothetical protein SAQ01S_09000 [Sphingomonas aquatilis NBRC 16722]